MGKVKPYISQEELYSYYINELKVPKDEENEEESKRKTPKKETTTFKNGNKKLIFVGGVHVIGDNYYTEFLKKLLEKEKPNIILVEDRADSDLTSRADRIRKKDKSKWTEVDWLINWGAEKDTPVQGMDIRSTNELDPYLSRYGDVEGMKISIFTDLSLDFKNPYVADPNKKFSLEEYYELAVESTKNRFLNNGNLRHFKEKFLELKNTSEYAALTIEDFIKSVVEEEADKYIDNRGNRDILDILIDKAVTTPYPFADKYKINKIWACWDAARDSTMIEECIISLEKNNKVVAVAGSGHIFRLKKYLAKAIKEKFGEVDVSVGINE